MPDFKDPVPHTGGVLTIHKRGKGYSLSYHHVNFNQAGLVELVAVKGEAIGFIDMTGVRLAEAPQVRIFLPTDAEGMYGRSCPSCQSYFRVQFAPTELCPYCGYEEAPVKFPTAPQRDFIRRQYDAIVAAIDGPDGDTSVSFDEQVAEPTRDAWVYSDEKQQTHVKCACRQEYDVLGEYVRCPTCGKRTAREVFTRKMAALSTDLEADAQRIPTDQREERERRWRHYVVACVAEFEALGRDIATVLASLPSVPARRKALSSMSFQSVIEAAGRLRDWFSFDVVKGIDQDERAFVAKMFGRRHLFSHNGGRVDQEYLDKTNDTTVRLNEVVSVRSTHARRILALVQKIGVNLLDDFESMK
jgi:hypothetical protein